MDCEASAPNLLERILLDANVEPTDLPLSLLKAITNNFSDDQRIGRGGFAVVYKGLLQKGTVAVKKLSQAVDIDQTKFNQEVISLIRVKHKNIVRFLGYCADTQGKVEKYEGKVVMADAQQRLLCFEFLPNGDLDGYITDASQGLEWRTRYQIIKGICEGLHYLHQEKIVHLDLKPANILLTHEMVPKIADFGLSRCFDEKQSRIITSKMFGTQGYLAPEFFSGVITFQLDIYSLGVIIIEILTGQKGYHAIDYILESWSNRFEKSIEDKQLEQVRVCAKIGLECMDSNPVKRPSTQHIIDMLNGTESGHGFVEIDQGTSSATHLENKGSKELQQGAPKMPPGGRNSKENKDSAELLKGVQTCQERQALSPPFPQLLSDEVQPMAMGASAAPPSQLQPTISSATGEHIPTRHAVEVDKDDVHCCLCHPNPAVPELEAYSMREFLAACARLRDLLVPLDAFALWFRRVREWDDPVVTVLALSLFLTLTWHPDLILPTLFLYLFFICLHNFLWCPTRRPAQQTMEQVTDDGVHRSMLEEEEVVVDASVQLLVEDVATLGERVHALLTWRDGRATAMALAVLAPLTIVLYVVPLWALVAVAGVYEMRPPWLKEKEQSAIINFFRRLPMPSNDCLVVS